MRKTYTTNGLSDSEAEQLAREGFANVSSAKAGKSVKDIVISNTLTYFNFIFLIITVLLCAVSSFRNLTFLPIVVRVALWQAVSTGGSAIADMLGIGELSRLLKSVGSALSIMLAIALYYAMLFIVSTSLMILAFKGG